jgi:hypothetical protein
MLAEEESALLLIDLEAIEPSPCVTYHNCRMTTKNEGDTAVV